MVESSISSNNAAIMMVGFYDLTAIVDHHEFCIIKNGEIVGSKAHHSSFDDI